jgi:hypothetical protein
MIINSPLNLVYERIAGLALAGPGSRGYTRCIDHVGGRRHGAMGFKVRKESQQNGLKSLG